MTNADKKFTPLSIAVMTISDSRDMASDRSGRLLAEKITSAQHHLAARAIVPDTIQAITQQAQSWIADQTIHAIIATGGTGIAERDVSYEAFSALYEKTIPGFAFAFHQVSMQHVGLAAVLSRASAGLAKGTLIFSLPGSPSACRDAWDEILVFLLDNRTQPCNFVDVLPSMQAR